MSQEHQEQARLAFPKDINLQTCTSFPLSGIVGEVKVGIDPNNFVAVARDNASNELARVAVVVFDDASQSYVPAKLSSAADGALEIHASSLQIQRTKVLIQGSGTKGYGVVARLDNDPIIVRQTGHTPIHYEELLSVPGVEDESPKDETIRTIATSLGMNPDKTVELSSRVCYPEGQDYNPLEGYILGQSGGKGELSVEVARRQDQPDIFATRGGGLRGFSFDETFIGEGTVHQTHDAFYRSAAFRLRMADQEEIVGNPSVQGIPEPSNTRPDVEQRLKIVPDEEAKRLQLLASVSINKQGIASCVNPSTNVETIIAAVRIDKVGDTYQAALLPFSQAEDESHTLQLPVSADKPTRVGFFIGHKSPDGMSVAFRNGEYPGKALNTQNESDELEVEIPFNVGGIRENEMLERQVAEQIGLFTSLGFEPTQTRGVLVMGHKSNPLSDTWDDSPLVFLPTEKLDLLRHYDPNAVKVDELQVLAYGTREPMPTSWSDALGGFDDEFDFPGTLRGGFDDEFDFSSVRRGVGLGFGNAEQRFNPTTQAQTVDLEGAFRIVAVGQ